MWTQTNQQNIDKQYRLKLSLPRLHVLFHTWFTNNNTICLVKLRTELEATSGFLVWFWQVYSQLRTTMKLQVWRGNLCGACLELVVNFHVDYNLPVCRMPSEAFRGQSPESQLCYHPNPWITAGALYCNKKHVFDSCTNYHKMNETTKQLVANEHLFVQRSITTSVFAYQKIYEKNYTHPTKPPERMWQCAIIQNGACKKFPNVTTSSGCPAQPCSKGSSTSVVQLNNPPRMICCRGQQIMVEMTWHQCVFFCNENSWWRKWETTANIWNLVGGFNPSETILVNLDDFPKYGYK